jgi:hypothetical protein
MLEDGSAVATWVEFVNQQVEFANQQAQFKARRITSSGAASAPVSVQGPGAQRVSGFPRMTRQGDELLFAWTEGGEGGVQVKGAVARLR